MPWRRGNTRVAGAGIRDAERRSHVPPGDRIGLTRDPKVPVEANKPTRCFSRKMLGASGWPPALQMGTPNQLGVRRVVAVELRPPPKPAQVRTTKVGVVAVKRKRGLIDGQFPVGLRGEGRQ